MNELLCWGLHYDMLNSSLVIVNIWYKTSPHRITLFLGSCHWCGRLWLIEKKLRVHVKVTDINCEFKFVFHLDYTPQSTFTNWLRSSNISNNPTTISGSTSFSHLSRPLHQFYVLFYSLYHRYKVKWM